MRSRLLSLGLTLAVLPALVLVGGSPKARRPARSLALNAKDAKEIAERETGGKAVSARRIPLNGASGGWEVEVHMAHEERGWRCIIDADTRMVQSKTRVDQPGGKAEASIRMVKGTR